MENQSIPGLTVFSVAFPFKASTIHHRLVARLLLDQCGHLFQVALRDRTGSLNHNSHIGVSGSRLISIAGKHKLLAIDCKDLIAHGVPSLHFYTMMATDSVYKVAKEVY